MDRIWQKCSNTLEAAASDDEVEVAELLLELRDDPDSIAEDVVCAAAGNQ
jgi:hypothetical protein